MDAEDDPNRSASSWSRRGPGRRLFATIIKTPAVFDRRLGLAWAAALTYHALLALIPALIIAFSLLGILRDQFGFDEELEQLLVDRGLPDAAAQAGDVIRDIVEKAEQSAMSIGVIGGTFLLLTGLSLFSALEQACNALWLQPRRRHFVRLRAFLAVMLVGPVLAGVSLFVTARLQAYALAETDEILGPVLRVAVLALPVVLTWVVFYFPITFLPNTRVRQASAIFGAVVAGTMWEATKWGFNFYVYQSATIDVVYGRVAILPVFVIWTHLTWLLLLVGVQIANVHQNGPGPPPEDESPARARVKKPDGVLPSPTPASES